MPYITSAPTTKSKRLSFASLRDDIPRSNGGRTYREIKGMADASTVTPTSTLRNLSAKVVHFRASGRPRKEKSKRKMFHEKRHYDRTYLSPQKLERARELRADRWPWHKIAETLEVSAYVVRCEIEPGYRDYKSENARRQWADIASGKTPRRRRSGEKIPKRTRRRAICNHRSTADERVPDVVLRDRENRKTALERRTLAQTILGDPPPGYSALDQRARGGL